MAARADKVSRVDHDGVTLVEGATSDVRFAFTERAGGVSEDAYSSLNLGSHVGDDPFAVQENRRRALEAMGAAECEHNLLVPNQVHGDHIVAVTSNGADDLEDVREQIAEGCDAIVCTAHNVPVLLSIAGSKDLGIQERITVIATGFSDSNVNRQDELFAAQQSQSKAAASAEPQRTAPATSPAQAAPTRNVGGTELPNFGNDQFELPDFLKRGSF